MDKKGETIEVSDLYKKIKIIENEISMKKKTLDELNEKSPGKELLIKDLEEKEQELNFFKKLVMGVAPGLDRYVINDKETPSYGKQIKTGEISFIADYVIKEPAKENLFLIHGLEKYGVTVSDVVSYNDNTSTKKLTIAIRNNVVDCPIVEFDGLASDSRNRLSEDISIEILDTQLKPVYKMIYKEPIIHSLGDLNGAYDSCKPQIFTVTLSYRVREMVKVKKDGTTN